MFTSKHPNSGPTTAYGVPHGKRRRWKIGIGITAAALTLVPLTAGTSSGATNQPQVATVSGMTSIQVQGNRLVDQNGTTVQLRGVNRPSTEYACIQGWGLASGPLDDAELAVMQNVWRVNAVRVPLNESCWLGHGPANLSGANYQNAIRTWVGQITARGMVAILDMHWSEAGSQLALDQQPMPDRANAPTFWKGVANTFKNNRLTIFDLYNEPYPDHPENNLSADQAWPCWRDGCTLPVNVGQKPSGDGATFQAAGMQELVNAVRSTQATNPVMLGGLDYSGDLSEFLTHMPTDPRKQIVASWHAYPDKDLGLDHPDSWDQVIAPVAATVPVVAGEFGRYDCTTSNTKEFLDWMDAHTLSYLAWAWLVDVKKSCPKSFDLIKNYSTGEPTSEYSKFVQQRYITAGTAGRHRLQPATPHQR